MKKFLKFALKSHWKEILVILVLVVLQTFFQIQIIKLFISALSSVSGEKIHSLIGDATLMVVYTILSMITIYSISFLSTKVSSKIAFNTREKLFHILMNLPDGEIDKFKISGLISRSTRGVYSEQRFIMLMLDHFFIIPSVFLAVVIEIALIDRFFAVYFAAIVIALSIFLIFKFKQLIAIYAEAKKTYGAINSSFLSKITALADNVPFKKQEFHEEFEKACNDSYDKNIRYQLSQYYLGPELLLVLEIFIVLLFAIMTMGYDITLEVNNAIRAVAIIQYILYFIMTLVVVPTIIERFPVAYVTSLRLEEVLDLEDKIIKAQNINNSSKRIEIIKMILGMMIREYLLTEKRLLKNSIKYWLITELK